LRPLSLTARRLLPKAARTLIVGRYPPEQAPELILGRPAGIKTVITFSQLRWRRRIERIRRIVPPGRLRTHHPVWVITGGAFLHIIGR
jgi:hypothetical protein